MTEKRTIQYDCGCLPPMCGICSDCAEKYPWRFDASIPVPNQKPDWEKDFEYTAKYKATWETCAKEIYERGWRDGYKAATPVEGGEK